MASNSIGSAALYLTTNSTQLNAGLATAKKSIAGFGASFNGVNVMGTGMFGGVVVAARKAITEIEDSFGRMHDINKGASQFGMSAESFATMSAAIRVAGLDSERFGKALTHLSIHLADLNTESREAQSLFAGMGIAAADLIGQPIDVALEQIMNGLLKIQDPAARSVALIKLVGAKAGPELAALLNQGVGSLQRLKEMLPAAIGENANHAGEVEKVAEQYRLFHEVINSAADSLVIKLVPAMEKVATFFKDGSVEKLHDEMQSHWWGHSMATDVENFQRGMDIIHTKVFHGNPDNEWHEMVAKKVKDREDAAKAIADASDTSKFVGPIDTRTPQSKLDFTTMTESNAKAADMLTNLTEAMNNYGKSAEEIAISKLPKLDAAMKSNALIAAEQKKQMDMGFGVVVHDSLTKLADELSGLDSLLQRHMITESEYYQTIAKISNAIITSSGHEDRHAEAATMGSVQASEMILAAQRQETNPKDALRQAIEDRKQQTEQLIDLAKQQLQVLRDRNVTFTER